MAESLIRLGRADEALTALDEAVAALPKDGWLASVREEARAVEAGAPINLLLNPRFDRDGSWALRLPSRAGHASLDRLVNAVPSIADGQVRLPSSLEGWSLAQEVFNLGPESTYRLTLRLRAEGLGTGAAVVSLVPSGGGEPSRRELKADEAAEWTTVTLEARPDAPASSLTVVVELSPGMPPGAVVWCDDAALIPTNGSP